MRSHFQKSWDVFVVGGGPAGLAAAIAARKHGLTVLVADGAIPPIDKSCGEGLMPDGVQAWQKLGMSLPLEDAYPFRGIRFVDEGCVAESSFPRGTAYGIRRTSLHRAMVDHAAACGVETLWQAAVTGLRPDGALVSGELVRARWVVGADGSGSRVRRWANLEQQDLSCQDNKARFAFRRHYRISPWTDLMELYWGRDCQVYVTPVSRDEVCVALISSNSKLRLAEALKNFPQLSTRLEGADYGSSERGAITITRRLRRIYRGNAVLIGDASGGVDAITGEGLCLTFRQAALLGKCLAEGNLARYQKRHHALSRRPALMARMMLFLARHHRLRKRTIQVFQETPKAFAGMLAMHVGEGSARNHLTNGITLGWEMLKA
jgi:flavin-dependent dehydrogenase